MKFITKNIDKGNCKNACVLSKISSVIYFLTTHRFIVYKFYNFVELTIKCYKLLLAKMAVYDLSALLRYGRPEFESRLMKLHQPPPHFLSLLNCPMNIKAKTQKK